MRKRFYNIFKNLPLDYFMLSEMAFLIVIGFLCLYSVIAGREMTPLHTNFGKQLIWFFLGFVIFLFILFSPFQLFFRSAYFLYAVSVVLLLIVLFYSSGRVHRWISLGNFQFQPSEFSKVATMLALARYLSLQKEGCLKWRQLWIPLSLVIIPVLLILKQPDVGTASVFFAILITMVIWAGMTLKTTLLILIPCLALVCGFHVSIFIGFFIVLFFGCLITKISWWKTVTICGLCFFLGLFSPVVWSTFESYQQQRILIFLGIKANPRGAAYQVIQSRIAIGSGGVLGKGFMHGSQTQLRFLPEQHTDFIFSVLGEEFGFIGVMTVLVVFLFLFSRLIHTAKTARNPFGGLVAVGCVSILAFQFFVNVGMTVGLVPVTGLPLPFLSYGGSSLVMTLVLMGLVMNVSAQRYLY
ncbi:rod shape-determining protein RodA [bacterium]|nr:rod shape-determining protein RodA [bacterium]